QRTQSKRRGRRRKPPERLSSAPSAYPLRPLRSAVRFFDGRCMKRVSRLFSELDATTSTNEKVQALTRYFSEAPGRDAAWAVYFLAGGKPRQVVKTASLVGLACQMAQVDDWLFDECYQSVGDLAETLALVVPSG